VVVISETGKKLDVLFVQPTYAKYRRPLFEKFCEAYNTTLFFIGPTPPIIQDEPKTANVIRDCSGLKHNPGNRRLRSATHLVSRYLQLLAFLITHNYDLVVTSISISPQTLISLFISRLKHKKCVLWIEEWSQSKSKFLVSKNNFLDIRRFIRYRVFRNVDAVVVEGTPQWRYAKSWGVPKQNLFFSNHCSLDYSRVKFRNLRKELNVGDNLVILYVGRIAESKGLDVLIRAYSRIERRRKNTHLILCGDGYFRPFCEDLVQKLQLEHVLFMGDVLGDSIASYYRMADVFVLPSCIRPFGDGWGLVINEAMSLGLPIVTTDAVGAAEDLVKNGINGYVVKNGDAIELYTALSRILDDDELRNKMAKNSKRIFRLFNDFDKMFEGFRQSIEYSTSS
jgi:glycosyltransferase involved in cell wall biosynthesis